MGNCFPNTNQNQTFDNTISVIINNQSDTQIHQIQGHTVN